MSSNSGKFRFVRCPKCLQVLAEYAVVPVYQCGGCSTVLKAKNQSATGQSTNPATVGTSNFNQSASVAMDTGSVCPRDHLAPSCSNTNLPEMEHERKGITPSDSTSSVVDDDIGHDKGESVKSCGKLIEERGNDTCQVAVLSCQKVMCHSQLDDRFQDGSHEFFNVEADRSLAVSQEPKSDSKMIGEVDKSLHCQRIASDRVIDKAHQNGHVDGLCSPITRSSNFYNGSASSSKDETDNRVRDRYLLKSRRTFRQKPLVANSKEERGNPLEDGKLIGDVGDHQWRSPLSSMLSDERHQSASIQSFNTGRDEFASGSVCEQQHGTSLDSEDFQSILNLMDSDKDCTVKTSAFGWNLFQNQSNKFKNLEHERIVRLRKMDELRDQLSRFSGQQMAERKYHHRGISRDRQSDNYDAIQELSASVNTDSISPSHETYYEQARSSIQCSCLHCRLEEQRLLLLNNYCNNVFCSAQACNVCYHSSFKGIARDLNAESRKSSFKDKRPARRRALRRPVADGAPFIICSNCFNILQIPADIPISRKKLNKLQCGNCSKVLMLSFPTMDHMDGKIRSEKIHHASRVEDNTKAKVFAAAHSAECPQGDSLCISEEYGTELTRSYSTGSESMHHASRAGKQSSGSALHQLMGYSSASGLLR